jgi:hypothetical protein
MFMALAFAGSLLGSQDVVRAADYFPLVPGTRWVYSDSASPGTVIEEIVKPAVVPNYSALSEGKHEGTSLDPFFPVEVRQNGQLAGKPCFRSSGDTLYLVGSAPNRPSIPRPILKVGSDQVWEYDSDPISPIDPTPVHVVCRAKPGPMGNYFGKLRKTVVLTTDASVGGKKGLRVHQIAVYAEGVGMVQFDEDGTAGGKSLKHSRKLVTFEPKEGTL